MRSLGTELEPVIDKLPAEPEGRRRGLLFLSGGLAERRRARAEEPSWHLPARFDASSGLKGRTLRAMREGRAPMRAARVALAGFFVVVIGYGLVAGGHTDSFTAKAGAGIARLAQDAGLTVREIRISGQNRVSDDEILTALGLEAGGSVFSIDTYAARRRLEKLPWVKHATIKRMFPASVEVTVEERQPFAIWQRAGKLHIIDDTGRVVQDLKAGEFAQLPLFVGQGAAKGAAALLAELDARPALRTRMRAAIRVADRRWNIRLHNGIDIRLPETKYLAALDRVVELDAKHGLLSRDIRAVDLRINGRVTLQLTDAAAKSRKAVAPAKSRKRRDKET